MKVVIDMNLSPTWVGALEEHGFTAVHWSSVGDGAASDPLIMKWARDNGYVIFTNDLDFSAILAASKAETPSVIQVRARDVTPKRLTGLVVGALRQHETILRQGALILVESSRLRSRILPLT